MGGGACENGPCIALSCDVVGVDGVSECLERRLFFRLALRAPCGERNSSDDESSDVVASVVDEVLILDANLGASTRGGGGDAIGGGNDTPCADWLLSPLVPVLLLLLASASLWCWCSTLLLGFTGISLGTGGAIDRIKLPELSACDSSGLGAFGVGGVTGDELPLFLIIAFLNESINGFPVLPLICESESPPLESILPL